MSGTPRRLVTTWDHWPPTVEGRCNEVEGGRESNSNASAHTCTCASNTRSGDHHDQNIVERSSIDRRTDPVSRDDSTDCGSTRATRPPIGSTTSPASARNSAATSPYGPPPRLLAPPRVVAVAICDRNGGFPITRS